MNKNRDNDDKDDIMENEKAPPQDFGDKVRDGLIQLGVIMAYVALGPLGLPLAVWLFKKINSADSKGDQENPCVYNMETGEFTMPDGTKKTLQQMADENGISSGNIQGLKKSLEDLKHMSASGMQNAGLDVKKESELTAKEKDFIRSSQPKLSPEALEQEMPSISSPESMRRPPIPKRTNTPGMGYHK